MGNQCSCITSLAPVFSPDLSYGNNPPVAARNPQQKPEEQVSIYSQPLLDPNFKNFPKTARTLNNNNFNSTFHKYLMVYFTRKNFLKKKEKYLAEGEKIYNFCVKTIYKHSQALTKAELYSKVSHYQRSKVQVKSEPGIFDDAIHISYGDNYDKNKTIENNIINSALSIYKGQLDITNTPNGFGEKISRDGTKETGTWKNGEFTGEYNRLIDRNGDTYQGNIVKGVIEGEGEKYSLSTQTLYIGNFVGGKKEGKGKEVAMIGTYIGEFKNDAKNGKGKYLYTSGDSYEGDFVNDNYEGEGHFIWKTTGYEYIGQYKNGIMHGNGIYKWSDSEYYKGSFVNGIKEGQGEMKWTNGRKFIGPFKNGKPHGVGMFENGINFKGEIEFIDGKLNKKSLKHRTATETTGEHTISNSNSQPKLTTSKM